MQQDAARSYSDTVLEDEEENVADAMPVPEAESAFSSVGSSQSRTPQQWLFGQRVGKKPEFSRQDSI